MLATCFVRLGSESHRDALAALTDWLREPQGCSQRKMVELMLYFKIYWLMRACVEQLSFLIDPSVLQDAS